LRILIVIGLIVLNLFSAATFVAYRNFEEDSVATLPAYKVTQALKVQDMLKKPELYPIESITEEELDSFTEYTVVITLARNNWRYTLKNILDELIILFIGMVIVVILWSIWEVPKE